jgi:phenylpropionate dioxygenase-like ring-hydroxylating dioxygenase large terminal subunit
MPEVEATIADRLVDHIRNRTTDMADHDLWIPTRHFVDKGRADAEVALMRRLPLIVAHHSELPEPGNFITRSLLGTPLIIVRQSDGTVAAFHNICKHRGGRVEPEAAGSKRVFMCAYHGWTYERDGGGLRSVPFRDCYEEVDVATSGLTTVRAEERHGLVWITLQPGDNAATVADYLGPEVEEKLRGYQLDQTVVFLDEKFDLEMNWKLVMDGAIDMLHPMFLHPNGVGKLIPTNISAWIEYGRHGQNFAPRKRAERNATSGEPVEATFRFFASNLVVYPNSMVIAAPDHVEYWLVWPDINNPAKSRVEIRFLVLPERLTDEGAGRLRRSWEVLRQAAVEEDWPMTASIQRNAIASPEGSYHYGRSEVTCQHLHLRLAEDLGGF